MRARAPSNAVSVGTASGATLAPLIMWALSLAGVPLPADPVQAASIGSALGGLLTGALAYFSRGGRRGEAH